VGGSALSAGEISLGDFIEVNTRLLMLSWPAISVGLIISIFSQGRASLERINTLLAEEPAIADGTVSKNLTGTIELQNVRVGDAEKTILGPISTRFESGTVTGIVGPSGSGKSTLISCLLRQEERMQGAVLFDGTNAVDYRLNALFAQVATVLPEPFLFGESLRSNLCFAQSQASDDEVARVISIVGLDDDIKRMTHGLATLVGEKGVMLSGGQRQRVALARALLAKPKVLILDDCFSAVDAETEMHIVDQLRKNQFAQTVILVSHRLAAMRFVDHILVLDQGQIVESGRHSDLLNRGKLYPALWGVETLKEQLVM
jgi:ATP-binding cassette subfamily B protein